MPCVQAVGHIRLFAYVDLGWFVFFFKQKTAYEMRISDWSSDVCSSDLLGIAITAYGVLSRGLIGGHWRKAMPAPGDFRGMSPRFQGGNLDANLALAEALRAVAEARGVSVAQAADRKSVV